MLHFVNKSVYRLLTNEMKIKVYTTNDLNIVTTFCWTFNFDIFWVTKDLILYCKYVKI